jgi:streptogramin lyase
VRYQHDPKNQNSLRQNVVSCIFQDHSGMIWLGNGVLSRFDPSTESFTHYPFSKNQKGFWSSDAPSVIFEDRSQNLWIGTGGSGVIKIDLKPKKFAHYKHDQENTNSLSDDDIRLLYEARDGTLWIGTRHAGVNRYDPATEQFTHFKHDPHDPRSLSDNRISAIYEDHTGTIWVGTFAGLNRFDLASKGFARYLHDPNDPFSISDDEINTIYESRHDGNKTLWIGTQAGGLNAFDHESEKFVHYKFGAGVVGDIGRANEVDRIHEDRFGNLLIVKWPEQLYLFDRRKKEFVFIETVSGDDPGWGIFFEDRHGRVWGGNCGLNKLDIKKQQFVRHRIVPNGNHDKGFDFAYNLIETIYEDANGMLWCGTRSGLHLFDPQTSRFIRHYYVKDGLPSNLIHQIVGDNYDNLWVVTGGGLSILNDKNPPGKKFKNFDMEFAALDYTNPRKNQYAYKLEGFNADWIAAGHARTAHYTNVPPGEYIFRVKGSNNDGFWNEEGTSIKIVIHPPYWFRGLAAFVVIGFVAWLYNYRVSKLLEIERTRHRIARDLHDEIGSSLSSIALMSELVQEEPGLAEKIKCELKRIGSTAQNTVAAMGDLVWTVNPQYDKLENLLLRMKEIAAELLEQKQICYSFHFPEDDAFRPLKMDFRHNLLLIYKEILHNIVKHAEAKHVDISITKTGGFLTLKLADDGIGFDPSVMRCGNGLKNIQARATELRGKLEIKGQPHQGTRVILTVKMP